MPEFAVAFQPSSSFGSAGSDTPPVREKEPVEPVPGGAKPLYRFRGRDSGAPPGAPVYVSWTGNQTSTGYPDTPPYGGPVVDIVFRRVK